MCFKLMFMHHFIRNTYLRVSTQTGDNFFTVRKKKLNKAGFTVTDISVIRGSALVEYEKFYQRYVVVTDAAVL